MPSESTVVICPNPKCHRKIEEPILLNNLSLTPAKQYYACPHCLIKLDMGAKNDAKFSQESKPRPAVHPSLEKVLNVISTQPQEEKVERVENKKEEEPLTKPSEKEEKGSSACPHHFGYLAKRPKNVPIPQECLTCSKTVDCMLKLNVS